MTTATGGAVSQEYQVMLIEVPREGPAIIRSTYVMPDLQAALRFKEIHEKGPRLRIFPVGEEGVDLERYAVEARLRSKISSQRRELRRVNQANVNLGHQLRGARRVARELGALLENLSNKV